MQGQGDHVAQQIPVAVTLEKNLWGSFIGQPLKEERRREKATVVAEQKNHSSTLASQIEVEDVGWKLKKNVVRKKKKEPATDRTKYTRKLEEEERVERLHWEADRGQKSGEIEGADGGEVPKNTRRTSGRCLLNCKEKARWVQTGHNLADKGKRT